jgi:2-dehydro-3-deoxygluconokinase
VYYYRYESAASRLSPEDIRMEWFYGSRIVHLTGITPGLSLSCAATCQKAIDLARQTGALVSFDPNFRPKLWSVEEARRVLRPFFEQADILLMGHEDAQAILETGQVKEALRAGAKLGAKVVVLKRAERGASAMIGGQQVDIPAVPVAKVVDPVGAGDGFDAGFLAGWLRGWPLEDCLRLGARVGAAAVGVMGDYEGYPLAPMLEK